MGRLSVNFPPNFSSLKKKYFSSSYDFLSDTYQLLAAIFSSSIFCRFLPQLDHFSSRCDWQLKPIKVKTTLPISQRPSSSFFLSTHIINSLLNHQVVSSSNSFPFHFHHFLRPVLHSVLFNLRSQTFLLTNSSISTSISPPFLHQYLRVIYPAPLCKRVNSHRVHPQH